MPVNKIIPVFNNGFIHFLNRGKRTLTMLDNAFVIEVSVSNKPNVFHNFFLKLFVSTIAYMHNITQFLEKSSKKEHHFCMMLFIYLHIELIITVIIRNEMINVIIQLIGDVEILLQRLVIPMLLEIKPRNRFKFTICKITIFFKI